MHCGDGFHGSNSVEIMNDLEAYEMARALDSDDDHPVGELTESDVEILRRIFHGRRDPRVMSSAILLILIRRVQKDMMMSS